MTSFTPHTTDPNLDLVLEREVDVAPELVFKAWTTPDLVKQWFAPKPWETPECEIDLRPGGAFHSVMRSPEGQEFPNTGCYLEIVPDEKLAWTSALAPGFRPISAEGGMPFTAIIELTPNGSGGTRYRAVAMHLSPEDRKQHEDMGFEEGWGLVLEQMVELLQAQ